MASLRWAYWDPAASRPVSSPRSSGPNAAGWRRWPSLWDVGCYPVSFARRLAGEEPDRVAAFARLDERGVDRTFVGQLHFPGGLLAEFDSGFSAADRESLEIVGQSGRLVLDSPFLPEPDGPPAVVSQWRGLERESIDVAPVDQYHSEVEDLMSAILDGTPVRVTLDFSRGTIATLVELDRAARSVGKVELHDGGQAGG